MYSIFQFFKEYVQCILIKGIMTMIALMSAILVFSAQNSFQKFEC